jgi:hypothetical protein
MEPLTIEQLKSLGFDIAYKKRKGKQVFYCACHADWDVDNLVGFFFGNPPTFKELVEQIAERATEKERNRIADKWLKQMLD